VTTEEDEQTSGGCDEWGGSLIRGRVAKRNGGASGRGKGAGERRQCGGETGASIEGKQAQGSASTLPPEMLTPAPTSIRCVSTPGQGE